MQFTMSRRGGTVRVTKARYPKACAATAAQIVYEYDGWGVEHVDDMFKAIQAADGRPPKTWGANDLYDAALLADEWRQRGASYDDAVKHVTQGERP